MNQRYTPLLPAASRPTSAEVDHVSGLSRIFDPDCNLVRLRCRLPHTVVDYLHTAHTSGGLGGGRHAVIDAGSTPDNGMLPDLPGRAAVHEDVRMMSELLADLTGCPRVGVRIEVLDRAMCPRWHVDRVGLRLLSTWVGPATEWLNEDFADRRQLGSDEVMTDARGIRRADAGDILLLKGEAWPDNAGRGVIHRSPRLEPPDRLRIVAVLDAVW